MSDEARRAVVAALRGLAGSGDFRDRADAGRALASFAADPEARVTLVDLVLDARDTFVTRVTAEALFRRHDVAGLSVVASAFGRADANRADWIHTALRDVVTVFGGERDAAVRDCEALTQDPDEHVRNGAAVLIDTLTEINPILTAPQEF